MAGGFRAGLPEDEPLASEKLRAASVFGFADMKFEVVASDAVDLARRCCLV